MAKVAAEFGSTANRYQILAKLAVGGMAEIFLARGASVAGVERYCVLKRILRERASDAQFIQMFVDEARLAAQLQHPNIASVYDIGMLGDSYFFTMEYVHGETVRSLLHRAQERNRPLPLACVLTIIAGTASGLHHAHERNANDGQPLGIVHRDVSPSNLMVSFEGNVKLVDFGVAKAADRGVETRSGTVKGKISYLSPEQCRAERVDRRSDLFSLGIVMWEMLTGRRLYRRTNDFENMTAIVTERPLPPSSHRREVPRAVDDIVLRLLAKSVADRFQTAGEVVEALENASMRAGTILSTSAVSRLLHDLFGVRAEPWLEIERKAGRYEPVSLASRPIPKELEHAPVDPVDLGLANVLDLSPSNAPGAPEAPPPPAPAGPNASAPSATTASTPGSTTLLDAETPLPLSSTLLDAETPLPLGTTLLDVDTPVPMSTTLLDAETPNALNTTLLDAAPPIPVPATQQGAAPPNPSNTTLLGVSAPSGTATPLSVFPSMTVLRAQTVSPARAPSASSGSRPLIELPASPSGPIPLSSSGPRPVVQNLPGSGPRPVVQNLPGSGPRPVVQDLPGFGAWAPASTQARARKLPASRLNWPLIIVIVLAAAIGVVVAWLSMRTGEGSGHEARSVAPVPISAPAPAPVVAADAGSAATTATPQGVPPEPGQTAGTIDAREAARDDASNDTRNDTSERVLPAPADAATPASRESSVDTPTPPTDAQVPRPADTTPHPSSNAPPHHAPSTASAPASGGTATSGSRPKAASPGSSSPSVDSLNELYQQEDYPAVMRICSAASVKPELGRVCFLSACREHNTAQAKRWLLVTRGVRDQLVTFCKQVGNIDVGSAPSCAKNTPGCP